MCDDERPDRHSVDYSHLNTSGTDVSMPTPGSWKTLPFGRNKRAERLTSKSMTLPRIKKQTPNKSPTGNRHRMGFARRWKKLYRSNSWEIRAYTHNYGHRSSISAGTTAEFPDLECIPGVGNFEGLGQRTADIDGTSDSREQDVESIVKVRSKVREDRLLSAPSSAKHDWIHDYRDCVGSLSALKSDAELTEVSQKDVEHVASYSMNNGTRLTSTDLRDSTISFAAELSKKHEEAKEGLLAQISRMDS